MTRLRLRGPRALFHALRSKKLFCPSNLSTKMTTAKKAFIFHACFLRAPLAPPPSQAANRSARRWCSPNLRFARTRWERGKKLIWQVRFRPWAAGD